MKTQDTSENLKRTVKEKYTSIAQSDKDNSGCCDSLSCCETMADDYSSLSGYVAEANLGLGCGLPTEFARIKNGDTVVDLGSGAGNDCFVAHAMAGENGRIIGIDFTPKMIEKARENANRLGYENIEFRLGDIEDIPLADNTADVVVSNCVLNLVPDKRRAFKNIFRILKSGAHFSVSDIVIDGYLPTALKLDAELYVGCVAGATQKADYLDIIREAGFKNIVIQKEKEVMLPENVIQKHLTGVEYETFKRNRPSIQSITVYAEKTATCCGSDCCH